MKSLVYEILPLAFNSLWFNIFIYVKLPEKSLKIVILNLFYCLQTHLKRKAKELPIRQTQDYKKLPTVQDGT